MSRRPLGFTLLEVLIALAVLAIALSAAFRAVGATAGSVEGLKARMLAEWVAQNRLANIRATGAFPPLGRSDGEAEQGTLRFHWREEVKATPNPLFRRVDVSVFDSSDQRELARLSGFAVQPLR